MFQTPKDSFKGWAECSPLQLENGEYTTTEKGTLEELFQVLFPGSEIILEPSGGWDGLELKCPKWKGSGEEWVVSRRVICYDKLKWAVFSFQPSKSPGMDGIMPIMLQQGFELLVGKLLMSLRAILALGYIPMRWRHIRVVFVPKPGKPLSQAKSLRPSSLMSFIFKTLEKLLDRHIRDCLVFDRLLAATSNLGFSTFGYAYDIVIIVQGKFAHTVREIIQEALNVVVKWAVKEGLIISPHKTAIVPFTNRRKTEGLGPLILHGKGLKMLDEVKYLGVIFDSKLNWNQHLLKIIRKAQTTFAVVTTHMWEKMGS